MTAVRAIASSSLMNLDQGITIWHELGRLELCRILEHESPIIRAEGVLHMRPGALLSEGESIYIRSPHFTGRLLCYGSRGVRRRLMVSWGKFEYVSQFEVVR